jgi:hypothetical protein
MMKTITADRVTVSLGRGQRKTLETIARMNGLKLAHVVRYALQFFIEEHGDKQIPLRFPASRSTGTRGQE